MAPPVIIPKLPGASLPIGLTEVVGLGLTFKLEVKSVLTCTVWQRENLLDDEGVPVGVGVGVKPGVGVGVGVKPGVGVGVTEGCGGITVWEAALITMNAPNWLLVWGTLLIPTPWAITVLVIGMETLPPL
jgi:hypothetical protein